MPMLSQRMVESIYPPGELQTATSRRRLGGQPLGLVAS